MKKKKILIVIGVILIGSIGSTFAYFTSKAILNGSKVEINSLDIIKDNELVAIRVKNDTGTYEKAKNIPLNGYFLNVEESYCGIKKVDGTYSKEEITITYENGKVTIDKMNKNGMKCFLYFDKAPCKGIACETILANNSIDISRSSGEFTSTFEEDTNGRIFKGPEDDYGDYTYFFAGKNPNNWVQFAEKWWRIIRINGDGSIRLIYSGSDATKTPQTSGEDTQIGTSAFNERHDDNAYVGYMYGSTGQSGENAYANTHTNTNSSTIKEMLDTWYENNIGNNAIYSSKIETSVGFCGDRKVGTTTMVGYGTTGYGANKTVYAPFNRVLTQSGDWNSMQTPTYKCNQNNDLYTVSSANNGNKALTYPLGLITSDEVIFTGGLGGSSSSDYWLYTNQYYWTMSPSNMNATNGARTFVVYSNGGLEYNYVNNTYGVRPAINLKADIQLSGIGTTTVPYVVV